MPDRRAELTAFVDAAGWGDAQIEALAGDASSRRYERLRLGGRCAIVMDADPRTGETVGPFLRAGLHLAGIGLSAPRILARDDMSGFLLLEDLGDGVLSRLIAADPSRQEALYAAATDVLVHLQSEPVPPWAAHYDAGAMAAALRPAWAWHVDGTDAPPSRDWLAFEAAFAAALDKACARPVLIHRDYHAENLVWLPERRGVARVGLLDFQDALAGHPAYDLASLLQDARRDVPEPLETRMIARHLAATGHRETEFRHAYALQAAQRQLRIMGVFSRLAKVGGKPGYMALIPRVRAYLERDLASPGLDGLRDMARALLPRQAAA